ncbi:MAG: squalene/phytoene synthase family protein [Paracoccaceae bacterium]|nr:squalene/phytoene synthase family protein [Paracoccaceae bacterium]
MSLQACADIVAKGDSDRFAAAMAAPVVARRILFPLYAFNIEVARAPWVTEEPMIAEMRLQWWRDALEEIAESRPVRRHEVATPLAEAITPEGARQLDALVAARRRDISSEPFEDQAAFEAYLDETGGRLMWTAAATLGAVFRLEDKVFAFGRATALARYLIAAPDLEVRGRAPLVDGRPEAIRALAEQALERVGSERELIGRLPPKVRPAVLEGWQTHALLRQIAKEPGRVAQGRVGLSEVRKRWRLLRWA